MAALIVDPGSGMCQVGLGVVPRAVFPVAGFAGYDAHRAVSSFVALADEARGDSTGAVLVQGDMPVVIASGAFDQTAQKNCGVSAVAVFSTSSFRVSVVVQRPIPMVVFRPEDACIMAGMDHKEFARLLPCLAVH